MPFKISLLVLFFVTAIICFLNIVQINNIKSRSAFSGLTIMDRKSVKKHFTIIAFSILFFFLIVFFSFFLNAINTRGDNTKTVPVHSVPDK
jgi:ABC-type Fe3+ transport system permease subunit